MFGPSSLDGAGAKRQTRETYFLNTPRSIRKLIIDNERERHDEEEEE